ncbi:MAG: NAD(P)-dependent oxidoreductase [Gulosibacter sp.]|uniref:NAD(P)-dependent oxidoreductase n=1 Tax=Gulosibacter sp. TaxID=2817531 RepID=UPI003F92EA89
MARITVVGGSGYAGSNIVKEAASRGHQVTAISRNLPQSKVSGVTYIAGDILERSIINQAVSGSDVVVSALSPREDMAGKVVDVVRDLANAAKDAGVRLGVVGGAGSLLVSPDGPKLLDTPDFPEEFKTEPAEMGRVLDNLHTADETLDWFFLSPAGGFGAFAPGERTGEYRLGGDVLLTDEEGNSNLSGEDLGVVIVDEIETPAHRRQRFTAAY